MEEKKEEPLRKVESNKLTLCKNPIIRDWWRRVDKCRDKSRNILATMQQAEHTDGELPVPENQLEERLLDLELDEKMLQIEEEILTLLDEAGVEQTQEEPEDITFMPEIIWSVLAAKTDIEYLGSTMPWLDLSHESKQAYHRAVEGLQSLAKILLVGEGEDMTDFKVMLTNNFVSIYKRNLNISL